MRRPPVYQEPKIKAVPNELIIILLFQELQYMAVSSFVFLRFFVPAIMNPKLFYLNSNHPNMRISRTLMLCAKVYFISSGTCLVFILKNLLYIQIQVSCFSELSWFSERRTSITLHPLTHPHQTTQAMQQIGNMCAQPCKESFMLPLLPFIERQTGNVRHFIKDLVTIYKCK